MNALAELEAKWEAGTLADDRERERLIALSAAVRS